jgi:hypothetical protein
VGAALAKAKNSSAAFSSRPTLLSGSIMIRPRADTITASARRKGVGRKILCECELSETLCAESHISAATPARRRRAGLSLRRQAEAIVKTSTSHDRDRSSAFLVANFSGAGTSSSPQASHRMDGACCASLCSHQDISRRLLLRGAIARRGNVRKTVGHPLDGGIRTVTSH